jgi:hypothetical protein
MKIFKIYYYLGEFTFVKNSLGGRLVIGFLPFTKALF